MLKIGFNTFAVIFAVNIFIAGLFLVNGSGLSLAYSIIQFKKDVAKFKVFAKYAPNPLSMHCNALFVQCPCLSLVLLADLLAAQLCPALLVSHKHEV